MKKLTNINLNVRGSKNALNLNNNNNSNNNNNNNNKLNSKKNMNNINNTKDTTKIESRKVIPKLTKLQSKKKNNVVIEGLEDFQERKYQKELKEKERQNAKLMKLLEEEQIENERRKEDKDFVQELIKKRIKVNSNGRKIDEKKLKISDLGEDFVNELKKESISRGWIIDKNSTQTIVITKNILKYYLILFIRLIY